jgi:CHAD domain-containing protein
LVRAGRDAGGVTLPYVFRKSESVAKAAQRVARELLDDTLKIIRDPKVTLDVRTHEARKAIKKLRGMLRLVESSARYGRLEKAIDKELRDAARKLAPFRDSDVMRAALQKAANGSHGLLDEKVADEIHACITEHTTTEKSAQAVSLALYTTDITAIGDKIASSEIHTRNLPALEKSYLKTCNAAYDLMRRVLAGAASEEDFHEWRKFVKYHFYHTRLLAGIYGKRARKRAKDANNLEEILGQHHDLAVLAQRIEAHRQQIQTICDIDALLAHLADRQKAMEGEALKLGKMLLPKKAVSAEDLFLNYSGTTRRKPAQRA